MNDYQHILDFWFLSKSHELYGQKRKEWFLKDDVFDEAIRDNFEDDFSKALDGQYLRWAETKDGCMALILLFDQFSRNMFRDDPKAFSADGKAREIARHILDAGFFEHLPDFMKNFAVLPFEHSENLEDQIFSVKLFKSFGGEEAILYAVRHYEIIEKFGRFPHRNKTLNRPPTDEEIEFLKQPNSSF